MGVTRLPEIPPTPFGPAFSQLDALTSTIEAHARKLLIANDPPAVHLTAIHAAAKGILSWATALSAECSSTPSSMPDGTSS